MVVKVEVAENCKLVKMERGFLVFEVTGPGHNPAFILTTRYRDDTPVIKRVRVFVDESGRVKT
jgi:hypothetical protein